MRQNLLKLILMCSLCISLSSCTVIVITATASLLGSIILIFKDSKTLGTQIDDVIISSKISTIIYNNCKRDGENVCNISSASFTGKVLIAGWVKNNLVKDEIMNSIWMVTGVSNVIENLRVSKTNEVVNNALLTSALIKSKLSLEKGIVQSNYNYVVDGSTVYLIGKTTSESELERVFSVISNIEGINKIVNYVTVNQGK